jgi:hypothetical protein
MSVLKHLKTLQHVSITIQIIFRELIGSLLKSLNLKVFVSFLKLWRLFVVMWQHNVWRMCMAFCVERYAGLCRVQHTSPHRTPRHSETSTILTNINILCIYVFYLYEHDGIPTCIVFTDPPFKRPEDDLYVGRNM